MPSTVVRYQAKPDRADENQKLIEASSPTSRTANRTAIADRCTVPPLAMGATVVGGYH